MTKKTKHIKKRRQRPRPSKKKKTTDVFLYNTDDDLILDGGELKNEKTSRIEDISDMKNIKVIRE